jgi:hypothetical protein
MACRVLNTVPFRPLIFMLFMEPSTEVVAEILLSIASSQSAWRETMNPMTNIEPASEAIGWRCRYLCLGLF